MVDLKPGMTVWTKLGAGLFTLLREERGIWMLSTGGASPAETLTPLDPASPAGQALAALEGLVAGASGVGRLTQALMLDALWQAEIEEVPHDEGGARIGAGIYCNEEWHLSEGEDTPSAVAALRDKLEAAAVAAWERDHD